MDKKYVKNHLGSFLIMAGLISIILVGILIPTNAAHAWCASVSGCMDELASVVGQGFLYLLSWITGIAGMLLNFVLNYTIVKMKDNLAGLTGINTAWKVIRDIMNIGFIFLLVYEGILMIIGFSSVEKIKKFITAIVLAAILINFSLFFTKILIDASNEVTIGVYNSLVPNNSSTMGLSNSISNTLKLQTIYSSTNLGGQNTFMGILIFTVGAATILIVSAFVFFAVACMFVIRYVVLLVLLMLSPVAYMGSALPFMGTYSRQWWDSFKGQLLFAPLYMIMTSLVMTLMGTANFVLNATYADAFSNPGSGVPPSQSTLGLIMNFAIIIALLIISLVVSKKVASQGSKLISQATGKFTAYAGGTIMGGSAWAMRRSLGKLGEMGADSAKLQEDADKKRGLGGAWARAKLYTARTARDATFDARNASVPTSVIGDVIAGTAGRRAVGKKLGLDNASIPSIPAGGALANIAGVGRGGTQGYRDERAESDKKRRDREAANANELAMAAARKAIEDGANTTNPVLIDAMEKALSKLSVKQTEDLVASNRDLLKSQNFANKISVQQLEAINKSDRFSEGEKQTLKNARFSKINTAMTSGSAAVIGGVRPDIRNLSDSELDMVDPAYLENEHFVSHLKPGQMETINKSSKFTSNQKGKVNVARRAPLMTALGAGNIANIQSEIRKVDYKTMVSYMNVDGRSPAPGVPAVKIALDPDVLPIYNPKMLTRMADEMNDNDKLTLKTAILAGGNAGTIAWLRDPDKGGTFFI